MIVPRISGSSARSSALRVWSRAIQERTPFHRRVSTKAAAEATTARAAAGTPVAAAAAASQRSPPRNVPPKLTPIRVPGRAGIAIETFFVGTRAGVAEVADRLWAQAPGRDVSAAFKTQGSRGGNIEQLLHSNDYKKVFFDVRDDLGVLFHRFGVALRNVEDVQLMENAVRPDARLRGLAECLERVLSPAERKERAQSKVAGKGRFRPDSGGSCAVFRKRPPSPETLASCVGDVYYLPRLRETCWKQLSEMGRESVVEESKARVAQSQQKDGKPRSNTEKSKSKSPRAGDDQPSRAAASLQAQRDKHRAMELEFGELSVEWWDGLDDILAWEKRHL